MGDTSVSKQEVTIRRNSAGGRVPRRNCGKQFAWPRGESVGPIRSRVCRSPVSVGLGVTPKVRRLALLDVDELRVSLVEEIPFSLVEDSAAPSCTTAGESPAVGNGAGARAERARWPAPQPDGQERGGGWGDGGVLGQPEACRRLPNERRCGAGRPGTCYTRKVRYSPPGMGGSDALLRFGGVA